MSMLELRTGVALVLLLAGKAGAFITGQTLVADGGTTMLVGCTFARNTAAGQARVGQPYPSFYGAQSYDTIMLIASAMEAVKGDISKKDEFRAAFRDS